MLNLPHGCYCSELSVFPKNWKQRSASLKITWYIHYRFYDPASGTRPRQVFIKGMNRFKTLAARQDSTQALIDDELQRLQVEGYNPITRAAIPESTAAVITALTPFCIALKIASETMKADHQVKIAFKSVLKYIKPAAESVGLDMIPISRIRRKDIRAVLNAREKLKGPWTAHNYNFYRAYLMMLFKEIMEFEAIDENPVRDIQKMKVTKKIRQTLSLDKRIKIDQYLKEKSYPFWRFMHIFFHSGARESELINVRKQDVDLANQQFKTLIKKGRQPGEKLRTIKNQILPLWQELVDQAQAGDYLFSRQLVPGTNKISARQITRRWKRIKDNKELGISEDFYSLKHLNTTQVVDLLSEKDGAAMNAHTSTAMVVNIYDTAQERRQHERLKNVNNAFS
jgi:integrase